MQNIGMCAWSRIGATLAASSDVQPTTAMRFELLAIICWAAGTASAGSPRVSNSLQLTVCPMTPPALLMARAAGRHAAKYAGPSAASGPVKGAMTPMSRGDLLDDPLGVDELPQAASASVSIAKRTPAPLPTR